MKQVCVVQTKNLYKWAKNFKRIQDRFYDNQYKLRRLQQIEDFICLNGYSKVFHDEEVLLDLNIPQVDDRKLADLILVTHQGYSRYPLSGIVEKIIEWTESADLYFCLNRHYLNINNVLLEYKLPDDYQQAITFWLKESLGNKFLIVDLSRNYIDFGQHFTWSCPDRHYFISRK